MRRWLVPTILTAVFASTGVLALTGSRPPPAPIRTATPAAPVLSARRVPALLSQLVADARLRVELDAALANPALGAGRDRSCLVVRQGVRPVLSRRADQALIPASNLKVLAGVAALVRIGPDERLVTEVRVARPVTADGVVDGTLWLIGGGDPLVATADYAASFQNQPQLVTPLETLADEIVKAGVRTVRGGVAGDESRYDAQRYVPTWKPDYRKHEVGPASALSVNDGFAQFSPSLLASSEPATHAAGVLTGLLRARGVTVTGEPSSAVAPAGTAVVARIASRPIGEVVGEMLRESDNLTAELLVKEMGKRFGAGGTTVAGVEVMRSTLAAAGLPVAGLVAVDGSGLDRSDRASCDLLIAALQTSGPDGPVSAGLPVAGRDGTLARRFVANPAAGRLRAKTGALDGVVGLSGYVDGVGGVPPLVFALLINELPRNATGRALQEQVGAILARYPQAPAPADLAP